MVEGVDQEIRRLLARVGQEPVPEPSPDLIQRTLRRAHGLILMGDLLRLATLEALWDRLAARERDARRASPREDP